MKIRSEDNPSTMAKSFAGYCDWCGNYSEFIKVARYVEGHPSLCFRCNFDDQIRKGEAKRERRKYSSSIKNALMKIRGQACEQCGSIDNVHMHHITEVHEGGTDDQENLMLLCYECHLATHGKSRRKDPCKDKR